MKKLFKNGIVLNVFTDELIRANVLTEDDKIIGVGDYEDCDADLVIDVKDKYICPGFIDGHIHIESTMLSPYEFVRASLPKGTTTIVADPHEIANVGGVLGINYMLEATNNVPMDIYYALPSCVPATKFDESGAVIGANELLPFYNDRRVVSLGEVMDYPGVIRGDSSLTQKIKDALDSKVVVNGHAPLLSGKALDKYLSYGINDDHECSNIDEAKERISKGQWVMIREGTSAKNLKALLPLFSEPLSRRCILVTDDLHSADLVNEGHMDRIIRRAVQLGAPTLTAIRMATIQAAQCFGLKRVGAIAPGYKANILILDDLENISVRDVYFSGNCVVENKKAIDFNLANISQEILDKVTNSFNMKKISANDFYIYPKSDRCRVIKVKQGELLTDECIMDINWENNNGVDTERDIIKIAVIERHKNTGHIGLGFIHNTGLKGGAIASSVSHDSHNIVVIGTRCEDMALAVEAIRNIKGGCAVVNSGKVTAVMPLPIAGLMSDLPAEEVVKQNEQIRRAAESLGVNEGVEPFMLTAFMSLAVIPHLKITIKGLVDVDKEAIVSLYV